MRDEAPKYLQDLPGQLRAAADHEEAEHPDDTARDILDGLTPAFLRFDLAERELDSTYDLAEVADDPPRALAKSLDAANAQLRQRIAEAWGQSDIEPRFDNDDYVLRILVRTGKAACKTSHNAARVFGRLSL